MRHTTGCDERAEADLAIALAAVLHVEPEGAAPGCRTADAAVELRGPVYA